MLSGRLVGHTLCRLHRLCDGKVSLGDLVGDFLVRLDQITAQAAAGLESVDGEISLDIVAFSNLTLLDELEEPWETDTTGEPETQASSVDGRESLKVGVFAQSVVGLAEGNAWAAASDQASINWGKASEESAGPTVWTSGWFRDGLRLVQGVPESSDPDIDIIGVDGG